MDFFSIISHFVSSNGYLNDWTGGVVDSEGASMCEWRARASLYAVVVQPI